MRTCAITINGIIRDPLTSAPNDHGLALYNSLVSSYRVFLFADEVGNIEDWLKLEKISGWIGLVVPRPGHDLRDERLNQVSHVRTLGGLDFLIDPDPSVCADLFRAGVPTMLYSHPRYTYLQNQPGLRAWSELESAVDLTREISAIQEAA
jgi:hypothetical protein